MKVIAQAHNIPQACDKITDLVALPEVAVSISIPPFLHYEMAKTVLQAGKHLWRSQMIHENAPYMNISGK